MDERPVEFVPHGLLSQISEVEWPRDLPLPKEPNLPRGSRVIEMPNSHHKGIAVDRNGDHYHCLQSSEGYTWALAEDGDTSVVRGYK